VKRLVALELDPDAATRLADELACTNVTVQVGDSTQVPFPDESVDSVGCFTMLHHLPTAQEQFRTLRKAFRVLRSGGVLVGADSLASQGLHEFHEGDTLQPDRPRKPARLPPGGRLRPRHGLGRRRPHLHRTQIARGKEL
jgi:SAM-dependent methyltransferase